MSTILPNRIVSGPSVSNPNGPATWEDIFGRKLLSPLGFGIDPLGRLVLGGSPPARAMLDIICDSATIIGEIIESHSAQTADLLQFRSNGATNGDLLTFTSDGSLGIGINTPSEKCEIDYGHLRLNQESIASAVFPTVNPAAGNLNGDYRYKVTFVTLNGEAQVGEYSINVAPVNEQVDLSNIPIGTSKVIARNIYRTVANEPWPHRTKFVATIPDNTTTTYTDNIADGSLGTWENLLNDTGGLFYLNSDIIIEVNQTKCSIGYHSAYLNTGEYISSFGVSSAQENSGSYVSAFGYFAASENTGSYISSFGFYSSFLNSGDYVSGFGYFSAFQNTGSYTSAFGYYSAQQNSGNSLSAFGYYAARENTGNNVSSLGYYSAYQNTGNNISAFGYNSAYQNSGDTLSAFGFSAGRENDQLYVSAFGAYSAFQNTGTYASCFGYYAGRENSATQLCSFGYYSAYRNIGTYLSAFGLNAARQNEGRYVCAFGVSSAYLNIVDYVSVFGFSAAFQNTGVGLTGFGYYSGRQNSGDYVTGVGVGSAYSNSGDYATGVGYYSCYQNSGNNVVGIGYQSAYQNTANDVLIIQQRNVNTTPLIYGEFTAGNISINTTSIQAKLNVVVSDNTLGLPVLRLEQADVSEEFMRLIGESAADNSQSLVDAADLTTPGNIVGWIRVYIEDVAASGAISDGIYFMPFYSTPTA